MASCSERATRSQAHGMSHVHLRMCGPQMACGVQVAYRHAFWPYSLQRFLLDRQPLCSLAVHHRLRGRHFCAASNDGAPEGPDAERRASNAHASSSSADSSRHSRRNSRYADSQPQTSGDGWQNRGTGRFGASRLGAPEGRQKNPAASAASAAAQPHRRHSPQRDDRDRVPRRELQREPRPRQRTLDPELSQFYRDYSGFFQIDRAVERSRDGFEVGYFQQRFADAKLLNPDGSKSDYVKRMEERAEALSIKDPIHIGINVMLTNCTRWESIMVIVQDIGQMFDEINISTSMHRAAKLSRKYEVNSVKAHPGWPRLLAIVDSVEAILAPRQLANMFWALATLAEEPGGLVDRIIERLRGCDKREFKHQELSIIVWAFAVFGIKEVQIIDEIIDTMVEMGVDSFLPQALSNAVWGCATLEHNNTDLVQAVAEDITERHQEYSVQAMTNFVWGATTLGFFNEVMLDAVASEAAARLTDFNPQELSNLLVAYARAHNPPEHYLNIRLLEAMEGELAMEGRLKNFAPQALANSIWAFATLRYFPAQPCFQALVSEISDNLAYFKEQELVNIIWACAKLGYHPGRLLQDFTQQIGKLLGKFSSHATTSSLWALSVLQASRDPVFMALVDRMADASLDSIEPLQLLQLFQALMLARSERGTDEELLTVLPDRIHAHGELLWKASVSRIRVSGFHQEVSATLLHIGVPHLVEYVTPDGLFSIDIALRNGNQPIAVEVDGPYHFTCNTLQPLGHTLLRRRLLRAKMWTVLSVPYFEWYTGGDRDSGIRPDREKYMVDKLAGIGVKIAWPPVAGALPAPQEPALSASAAAPPQQTPRQAQQQPQQQQQQQPVGIRLEPVPATEAAKTPEIHVNGFRNKAVRPRATRLTLDSSKRNGSLPEAPFQPLAPTREQVLQQRRATAAQPRPSPSDDEQQAAEAGT